MAGWKLRKDKTQTETPGVPAQTETGPSLAPAPAEFAASPSVAEATSEPVFQEPVDLLPLPSQHEVVSAGEESTVGMEHWAAPVEDEPVMLEEGTAHPESEPVPTPVFDLSGDSFLPPTDLPEESEEEEFGAGGALHFEEEDTPLAFTEDTAETPLGDAMVSPPPIIAAPASEVAAAPPEPIVAEPEPIIAEPEPEVIASPLPQMEAHPSPSAPVEPEPAPVAPDSFMAALRTERNDPTAPFAPPLGISVPVVAPFVLDVPPSNAPAPPMSHRLIVRMGRLSAPFDLTKEITTIGRPDSELHFYPDVEIDLDDAVSRRHAEVHRRDGQFYVLDVGSTNGTMLNGEKLPPQEERLLAHGDRIRVGERTEIIFE